ncbi:MAG: response regulator, partial [Isosphaeraceae bacterium]
HLAPHGNSEKLPGGCAECTFKGLAVPVVDDSATNRDVLQEMLSNWRMKLKGAAGGHAALAEMEVATAPGNLFRLVLLDGHMPDMNGIEVTQEIRRHPDLRDIVLMLLSSVDHPGDLACCRELKIPVFLHKSVKQLELLDGILTALCHSPHKVNTARRPATPVLDCGRNLNVLLTEDDEINQEYALGLLQKRGHSVHLAGHGAEAVAAWETGHFDMILMDVRMPQRHGFAATAAIRQREQEIGTHTPIIALTAHAMKGDRQLCLAAGMDSYVPKAVRAAELFPGLEIVLQAQTGHASSLWAASPLGLSSRRRSDWQSWDRAENSGARGMQANSC